MVERLIEAAKALDGAGFERLGDYAARWRAEHPLAEWLATDPVQARRRRRDRSPPPHPRPDACRARVLGAARPRAPGRRDDQASSPARSATPTARELPLPRVLPGRARLRSAAADEPRRRHLARAGAEGVPGAAARPARHRPFDAGRDAARAERRRAGGLPRRTSAPTRSSATRSGSARELGVERWSVLGQSFGGFCVAHVPLVRPGGPARGVPHRRAAADRAADRRRLRAHLPPRARAQPPLLRALPRRPRARARDPPAARARTSALPSATG